MGNWARLSSVMGWSLVIATSSLAQAQEPPFDSTTAVAQDSEEVDDYEELDLDRLLNTVFTASKHEQDIADSPSSITVITRDQIENSYCSSVTCLLRQVPEMDVVAQKPMFTTVGARANNRDIGERTLVLVDGREINIELFGAPMWELLPVHMEDIERIEVIRGPGSALYGANAYSAVVSIVTRKAVKSAATAFLGAGEKGASNLHLRIDHLLGNFRLQLSGGRERNDSFMIRDLSERDLYRLRTRLEYQTDQIYSFVELGWSTLDGLLPADIAQFWIEGGHMAYAIASASWGAWQVRTWFNMVKAGLEPDFDLSMRGMELGKMPAIIDILATTLDGEAQGTFDLFKSNLLLVGGNYRWLRFSCPENNPDEINQHRLGLFVQDEQRLGEWLLLNASMRLDYNTKTPLAFSPRLAAVFRLSEEHRLRVAVGQAFRKPSIFNSSFHLTGVQGIPGLAPFLEKSFGNENLSNESINVYEIGYLGRLWKRQVTLEADVFFNQYHDGIIFYSDIQTNSLGAPDLSRSSMQFLNDRRERDSVGGSISLTYRLREIVHLSANYTYRYTYYPQEASTGSINNNIKKGDRVVWEPAHLYNVYFHVVPDSGPRAGVGISGRSAMTWWAKEKGSLFNPWIKIDLPGNAFLSAFASWRLCFHERWLELGIRATNVLNSDYQENWSQIRSNGTLIGAEKLGRLVVLFLRGTL